MNLDIPWIAKVKVAEGMLNNIRDLDDFANFLEVNPRAIKFFCYTRRGRTQAYRTFVIPKNAGGDRTLKAPCRGLYIIQRAILRKILNPSNTRPRPCVYSYIPGRSAQQMAARHVSRAVVIRVDIEGFFDAIHFGRVLGALKAFPMEIPHRWAVLIAQLCVHENNLPQGAPTSPALSNLICRKLDGELIQFARRSGFHYSRYSDDMFFSASTRRRLAILAERDPDTFSYVSSNELRGIVTGNGFVLNEAKTRVLFRSHKQRVVGAVCNRKVNVDRKYVRRIRTLLHLAERSPSNALDAYRHWTNRTRLSDIYPVLRGMIEYVRLMKGGEDSVFLGLAEKYNALVSDDKRISFDRLNTDKGIDFFDGKVFVCEGYHKFYGNSYESYGDVAILYKSGTCFFLKGVGLVTSFHNLFHEVSVFPPNNWNLKFQMNTLKLCDPKLDIAVFDEKKIFLGIHGEFRAEEITEPGPGMGIRVLGFPHFKSGDPLTIKRGEVIRIREKFGIRHLVLSTGVIEGESGGPVINDRGRVVGVVRSFGSENLAVPIEYVLKGLRARQGDTSILDWENEFTTFYSEGSRKWFRIHTYLKNYAASCDNDRLGMSTLDSESPSF